MQWAASGAFGSVSPPGLWWWLQRPGLDELSLARCGRSELCLPQETLWLSQAAAAAAWPLGG